MNTYAVRSKFAVGKSLFALLPLTLACLIGAGCRSTPPPAQTSTQPPAGQPAPSQYPSNAPNSAPGPQASPNAGQQQPQQYSQPNQQPQYSQPSQGSQAQQGQAPYPQQGGLQQRPQSNGQYPQNQAQGPRNFVIPAGTALRVRLDQTLSSRHNQAGDTFSATVESPVVVRGETIIRRGASASGTVTDAKGLGHIKGEAVLAIRLDRINAGGRSYAVSTTSVERIEKGKGRRSAEFAGGGAGLGALIGGLAGGGKGALIGAIAGGGAGTAGGAMTGNRDLVLPAETMLTFRTTRDVHVE